MSFPANVLKVLIASPGDTRDLRDQVEQALHEWNGDRGEASGVLLLPRRWETNAVPVVTGADGQTVINSQLVADADVVIGIFHATLGRSTPRAASGTAEELTASHAAGKPVHVYFSTMPIPRDHDREQLAALDQFKKELGQQGLYGSFDTPGSLKEQVKSAIEHDLASLELLAPGGAAPRRGASLRATYKYDREPDRQGRMKTVRQRLEVTNDGDATAEDVTVELQPVGDGIAPSTWGNDHPSPSRRTVARSRSLCSRTRAPATAPRRGSSGTRTANRGSRGYRCRSASPDRGLTSGGTAHSGPRSTAGRSWTTPGRSKAWLDPQIKDVISRSCRCRRLACRR